MIEVRDDVAVLVQEGVPDFGKTDQALAAAIATAVDLRSKKLLFDVRGADLANYYSYIVRHAESALAMGLDGSFRLAILGTPEQDNVMAFMVSVGHNRGWTVRCFLEMEDALAWLHER